jgi:hypothetical protein
MTDSFVRFSRQLMPMSEYWDRWPEEDSEAAGDSY